MDKDYVRLPLREIHQLMQSGGLTAEKLVQQCLDHIRAQDGALNAFLAVYADEAMAQARKADAQGFKGAPLHGIPIAIKDLMDVKGDMTHFGVPGYGKAPAAKDALVVERLRKAGAIVIGKTRLSEFAFEAWGVAGDGRTPRNPYDMKDHRVVGGSSSGSVVAVAAGMVPIATGSDTGGSIRLPAALVGIVGFKATPNAMPSDGVCILSPTFDSLGPFANHVEDAKRVYEIMAGVKVPDASGVRAARVPRAQWAGCDAEIADIIETAIARIEKAGIPLGTLTLPLDVRDYQQRTGDLIAPEGWASLGRYGQDPSLKLRQPIRERILSSEAFAADTATMARNKERRTVEMKRIREVMKDVDVFLMPATPVVAMKLDEVPADPLPSFTRYTRFGNYLDLIGLVLKAGMTESGLPVALQLQGLPGSEAKLFAFGKKVEEILAR